MNYVIGMGDDKVVGWIGDKIIYIDLIIYFYCEMYGKLEFGVFIVLVNKDDFFELCKKKCIFYCKDGFYWIICFFIKGERKIVDIEELCKLFDGSNVRMIIKDWLLIIFGVEFKGDIVDVRDIYNM